MARYRVLAPTFVKPDDHLSASLISAGSVIEFSGRPGLSLMPLDAAAIQAKRLSIPRYYRDTSYQDGGMIFRLARSLGAPASLNGWQDARDFVLNWLNANPET